MEKRVEQALEIEAKRYAFNARENAGAIDAETKEYEFNKNMKNSGFERATSKTIKALVKEGNKIICFNGYDLKEYIYNTEINRVNCYIDGELDDEVYFPLEMAEFAENEERYYWVVK